jgi:hypothetical protein
MTIDTSDLPSQEATNEFYQKLQQVLPNQPVNLLTGVRAGGTPGFVVQSQVSELPRLQKLLPVLIQGFPIYWQPEAPARLHDVACSTVGA